MKLIFYAAVDKERERKLAVAMCAGAERLGWEARSVPAHEYAGPEADVGVVIGVKGHSRRIIDDHVAAGRHYLYVDKGYLRAKNNLHREGRRYAMGDAFYKLALDGFQPTAYMMGFSERDDGQRWRTASRQIGLQPHLEQHHGSKVLWSGMTPKYARFHGISDPEAYGRDVISRIEALGLPAVYRPKQTWRDVEMPDAPRSFRRLQDEFGDARALIAHGSSVAIEALLSGIPVLTIGPCIAEPIAMRRWEQLVEPTYPEPKEILRWARAMSWCQWTLCEIESGAALDSLREVLH